MANTQRGKPPGEPEPKRPEYEVHLGRVKAAVWANEGEHGVRYSVTVARLYKDQQDKWQTSDSFGRDDLLLLLKVVDAAHAWIWAATGGPRVPF